MISAEIDDSRPEPTAYLFYNADGGRLLADTLGALAVSGGERLLGSSALGADETCATPRWGRNRLIDAVILTATEATTEDHYILVSLAERTELRIAADSRGLAVIQGVLQGHLARGVADHDHLMAHSWGGWDLSDGPTPPGHTWIGMLTMEFVP
ncbi:MAG: hypothetical protein HRF45_03615 [Fimbriimonadia bacterium]|jgi:hypothetical protein